MKSVQSSIHIFQLAFEVFHKFLNSSSVDKLLSIPEVNDEEEVVWGSLRCFSSWYFFHTLTQNHILLIKP